MTSGTRILAEARPLVLAFTLMQALAGQIVSRPGGSEAQWVGDAHVRPSGDGKHLLVVDGKGRVRERIPLPQREQAPTAASLFPGGVTYGEPHAVDGVWYLVRSVPLNEDPRRSEVSLLTWTGRAWEARGQRTLPRSEVVSSLLPFGEGRVLAHTAARLPEGERGPWSPLQVWRLKDSGELVFEKALDLGIPEAQLDRLRFEQITFSLMVLDGHAVLVAPHRARLWSFDLAQGRLRFTREVVTLPENLPMTAFGAVPMAPVVLGLHPLADGRLYLMTRGAEAVKALGRENGALREAMGVAGQAGAGQRSEAQRRVRETVDQGLAGQPVCDWWTFDPATGTLSRLPAPPKGGRELFHSDAELEAFRVRPLADGQLVPLGEDPAPPPAAKKAP